MLLRVTLAVVLRKRPAKLPHSERMNAAACSLHLAVASTVLCRCPLLTVWLGLAGHDDRPRRSKIGCGDTESWIRDSYRDPHLADLS